MTRGEREKETECDREGGRNYRRRERSIEVQKGKEKEIKGREEYLRKGEYEAKRKRETACI